MSNQKSCGAEKKDFEIMNGLGLEKGPLENIQTQTHSNTSF